MAEGDLIASVRTGGSWPMSAIAHATADTVQLELRSEQRGATWTARLHPRAPAGIVIEVTGGSRRTAVECWSMVRGIAMHTQRDVMYRALYWTRRELIEAPVADHGGGAATRQMLLRELSAVIRAAAIAATDRCDPESRRLSLRFLPHLRFRVYRRLVADPTRRLAEIASSCPGALIFALGLIEHSRSGTQDAGERLLGDVIAGRKLATALDDAVCAWLAVLAGDERLLETAPRLIRGVPAQRARDPKERELIRLHQRLLVRRATTQTRTTDLWLPPPLGLVPEDVPRAVRANARWFDVMKAHPLTLESLEHITMGQQIGVSRFLSRNIDSVFERRAVTRSRIQELVDYARATRRWPTRDSDPARVLRDQLDWHDQVVHEDLAALFGGGPTRLRELPSSTLQLAAPRFQPEDIQLAEVDLQPIASSGELFKEGKHMQHCVATRVEAAVAGSALVFRGTVHGQRVTVELVRESGVWTIGDFRCAANRLPKSRATRAIRAWAATACARQQIGEPSAGAHGEGLSSRFECPF
jgi:hypothetical protein